MTIKTANPDVKSVLPTKPAPSVDAKADAKPKVEAKPAQMTIELAPPLKRLWFQGVVYVEGIKYSCTKDEALQFLKVNVDGVTAFRPFQEKVKREVTDEQHWAAFKGAPAPTPVGTQVPLNENPKSISLTTPEEEAELGLDGDTAEV